MAVTDQTSTTLRVYRSGAADGDGHFDDFDVPLDGHETVLDALRMKLRARGREAPDRVGVLFEVVG